jgi:hypothetical protein
LLWNRTAGIYPLVRRGNNGNTGLGAGTLLRPRTLTGRCAHCGDDVVGIRPRPPGELGDQAALPGGDHATANQDVELAAATPDHLDRCLQCVTDQGSVTRRLLGDGGSRFAVDDLDVHAEILSCLRYARPGR